MSAKLPRNTKRTLNSDLQTIPHVELRISAVIKRLIALRDNGAVHSLFSWGRMTVTIKDHMGRLVELWKPKRGDIIAIIAHIYQHRASLFTEYPEYRFLFEDASGPTVKIASLHPLCERDFMSLQSELDSQWGVHKRTLCPALRKPSAVERPLNIGLGNQPFLFTRGQALSLAHIPLLSTPKNRNAMTYEYASSKTPNLHESNIWGAYEHTEIPRGGTAYPLRPTGNVNPLSTGRAHSEGGFSGFSAQFSLPNHRQFQNQSPNMDIDDFTYGSEYVDGGIQYSTSNLHEGGGEDWNAGFNDGCQPQIGKNGRSFSFWDTTALNQSHQPLQIRRRAHSLDIHPRPTAEFGWMATSDDKDLGGGFTGFSAMSPATETRENAEAARQRNLQLHHQLLFQVQLHRQRLLSQNEEHNTPTTVAQRNFAGSWGSTNTDGVTNNSNAQKTPTTRISLADPAVGASESFSNLAFLADPEWRNRRDGTNLARMPESVHGISRTKEQTPPYASLPPPQQDSQAVPLPIEMGDMESNFRIGGGRPIQLFQQRPLNSTRLRGGFGSARDSPRQQPYPLHNSKAGGSFPSPRTTSTLHEDAAGVFDFDFRRLSSSDLVENTYRSPPICAEDRQIYPFIGFPNRTQSLTSISIRPSFDPASSPSVKFSPVPGVFSGFWNEDGQTFGNSASETTARANMLENTESGYRESTGNFREMSPENRLEQAVRQQSILARQQNLSLDPLDINFPVWPERPDDFLVNLERQLGRKD
eukprot:comp11645_c0_seq1/m.6150 comp11645_c0_seq1/g.6150  ORF comp11645_c0_seq1/g.6150 comp11645_c0_seq1/m.6150 type:complete len:755 (-) comp11645_c0_seq1:130-2394(-)